MEEPTYTSRDTTYQRLHITAVGQMLSVMG